MVQFCFKCEKRTYGFLSDNVKNIIYNIYQILFILAISVNQFLASRYALTIHWSNCLFLPMFCINYIGPDFRNWKASPKKKSGRLNKFIRKYLSHWEIRGTIMTFIDSLLTLYLPYKTCNPSFGLNSLGTVHQGTKDQKSPISSNYLASSVSDSYVWGVV